MFRTVASGDRATVKAEVDSKRAELRSKLIAGADRLEVTSFTMNGQSASGTLSATIPELIRLLNLLYWMLDNGAEIRTDRTIPYFT